MATISNVKTKDREDVSSLSDKMLENPNRVEHETDARGRVIGVKVIEWIDSFDVSCLVGPEIADNNRAFGFALATCSVVEIDGEQVRRPQNKNELRALMQRLGNVGMNAASKALDRLAPKTEIVETDTAAIKN